MLHADSDERLTELARAGSDAAFEAIVARHRRSLVRLCARIVGETDAEEAVQNAMLSVHLALVRGDRVENLGAWLRTICRNASLNILRARAARPECSDAGRQLAEAHDDPTGRREQLGELVAAVQSLPQRQRDAIVMRELEGRSYEEIAHRLGATNGAVRQLLGRARATVRDRLAVLPGLEPLARWISSGCSGAAGARLGALASGCTLTAKLCASALVPAVIAGGGGFEAVALPASPARHSSTVKATAQLPATTAARRAAAAHAAAPTVVRRAPASSATATRVSLVRHAMADTAPRVQLRARGSAPRSHIHKLRHSGPQNPEPAAPTAPMKTEQPSQTPQQADRQNSGPQQSEQQQAHAPH